MATPKKSTRKTTSKESKSKSKPRKPKKISTKDKSGDIKEASIAKFMRKRTQLVGFDYGNFKHTQYAVEFIDNALDAIEKFQWDAETNLEKLKNNTASAITEFERFDQEALSLIERVKNDESDLVAPLKKLYKAVPNIIKKIQSVNEELQALVGIGISESESLEGTTLKGSVTASSFQQKYDAFYNEFIQLQKKYNAIINQISTMNKNPQFIFTLDKELTLENLHYLSNGVPKSTFKRKIDDSLKRNLRNFMESNGQHTSSTKTIGELDKDYIPETAKEGVLRHGKIKAIGPGELVQGQFIKPDLEINQEVIFDASHSEAISIDGETIFICNMIDIIATVSAKHLSVVPPMPEQ